MREKKFNLNLLRYVYIILTSIVSYNYSFGQDFVYSYDASGNRITRGIIPPLRSQNLSKDSSEVFSDKISDYEIKIYPNPTRDKLNIQIAGYENIKSSKLEVFDINSRLIYKMIDLKEVNSIDLSNQLSGNYFVNIIIDEKFSRWKVLKTN